MGTVPAPRTGNGVARILEKPGNYYSEYLYQRLPAALIRGRKYFIRFYVRRQTEGTATSGLGMFLTHDASIVNHRKLPYKAGGIGEGWNFYFYDPQIPNNFATAPLYSNTAGWTEISGVYTPAVDGVQHVLIGNFKQESGSSNASYLVDDVSIQEIFPHLDLIGIQKNGSTSSGKVEMHTATGESGLQYLINSRATPFPLSSTDWDYEIADYDKDGSLDLIGLKKANTTNGFGKVEMHVARASNNFSVLTDHRVTAFPQSATDWEFEIADYDKDGTVDIIGLKKNNTTNGFGKVEIHVARASNSWGQLTDSRVTGFPQSATDWEYEVADYDGDGNLDIIGIKENNTTNGYAKAEIHVARASNLYGQLTDSRVTAFPQSATEWEYEVINYDNDGSLDLVGIKKNNTGTGTTEVHLCLGSGLYQNLSGSTGTAFPVTNGGWEFAMPDRDSNINGARKSSPADLAQVSSSLTVYPNPSSHTLNLMLNNDFLAGQGAAGAEAKLYNAQGLLMMKNKVANGKVEMAVKTLPNGLYYLHVNAGDRVIKKTVLVKH